MKEKIDSTIEQVARDIGVTYLDLTVNRGKPSLVGVVVNQEKSNPYDDPYKQG